MTGNDDLVQVPSEEEIREAKVQLKNNKAQGEDENMVEMLKHGGESIVQWLTRLSHSICYSEEVPEDWWKQLVISLHKKGTYNDCDNFRDNTVLGKVFC